MESEGCGMKKYLPAITFFLIFGFALVADGLMESRGPGGFAKAGGGVIALSFLLLWLDEQPSRKRKPPAGGGSSNRRRNQRKR